MRLVCQLQAGMYSREWRPVDMGNLAMERGYVRIPRSVFGGEFDREAGDFKGSEDTRWTE
jgi:hypothetical protein